MIRQGIGWIVRWELLFVALLAPLLLFPGQTHGIAMAGVPLLWGLRWLDERHFIRRTPLDRSICLLLFMVLVSFLVTFDPELSLPKITGVVLGVACYYGIAAQLERPRDIWLGVACMIALGCAVDLVSLIGTSWFDKIPVLSQAAKLLPVAIRGLPGSPPEGFQPNQIAGALVWLLPLQCALLLHYRSDALPILPLAWHWPARIGLLITILLMGGTLLLTQSRGGYLGLLSGTLALFVLPRRRLLLATGVLIGIGIIIATLVGPRAIAAYQGIQSLQTSQALSVETLQGRFELWSRVISAIRDFPFTGMGMGTFRRVMPVLYPMVSLESSFDIGHAHNHLLNAALDLGLPGLIAYLALWMGAATMAYQALYRATDGGMRIIILGLSGGMVAHFVYGLTDTNALGSKPGLLLWLTFGLVCGIYQMASARPAALLEAEAGQR
jgi:putative inorganic carbon (HCO3(-)) transporter